MRAEVGHYVWGAVQEPPCGLPTAQPDGTGAMTGFGLPDIAAQIAPDKRACVHWRITGDNYISAPIVPFPFNPSGPQNLALALFGRSF